MKKVAEEENLVIDCKMFSFSAKNPISRGVKGEEFLRGQVAKTLAPGFSRTENLSAGVT